MSPNDMTALVTYLAVTVLGGFTLVMCVGVVIWFGAQVYDMITFVKERSKH